MTVAPRPEDHWRVLCATLVILFLIITIGVLSGGIAASDLRIEYMLYQLRSVPALDFFSWVTMLGNPVTVAFITAMSFYFCARSRRLRRYAPGLFMAVVGAAASDYLLKLLIARARPPLPIAVVSDNSFSFPSGHATLSVALYGFLAFILWHAISKRSEEVMALLLALILIVAIGFSRLYLGVHYPSDVAAGYLLGALWLMFGVLVTKKR